MSKGILKTFEAIVAALMVLTFFAVFFYSQSFPEFETSTWKIKAFNALKALDESNELRKYALENDTQKIEEKLQLLLPPNVNFKVLICEQDCYASVEAEKLVTVNYFIAGDVDEIKPRQVVLYVW